LETEDFQSVQNLLAEGVDVNAAFTDGSTPLRLAVSKSRDVAKLISPADSAWEIAVANDRRSKDIAKCLIARGADVNKVLSDPGSYIREKAIAVLEDIGDLRAFELIIAACNATLSEIESGMAILKGRVRQHGLTTADAWIASMIDETSDYEFDKSLCLYAETTKDYHTGQQLIHDRSDKRWAKATIARIEGKIAATARAEAPNLPKAVVQGGGVANTGNAFPKLQCPTCMRTYVIGTDACILTMETIHGRSAAALTFRSNVPSGITSLERPALVGTGSGDPEHRDQLIRESKAVAESIRVSLSAGQKEFWYCRGCNQKPPLEFPNAWIGGWSTGGQ